MYVLSISKEWAGAEQAAFVIVIINHHLSQPPVITTAAVAANQCINGPSHAMAAVVIIIRLGCEYRVVDDADIVNELMSS
ncbi:hypothetical protein DHEL01_v201574 [Diaporthe helianthi]|uniref:Uncharacterized protein n=1 Tax=Diaporthe helianthi TaxID=158607 RepID=A0A2P5IC24_DIAHE|nr:hypothetical protein DHEL01_v201574 [Diaporthe helianthi]